ncbi:KAP family P-loop NTPase fold protein [Tenacibaculum agarivorans]|uniref:KAP family P-loop NTPase fold protein n=1 Tax=Tenacibaculum agarivorans TaxID=1908389 RepID=UPI00094B7B16|nr:P-loop NTPase fold protein [Tenacibaculum agarivorans]
MTKLLPNLPVENLTKENDYIGILNKGNIIKSFFLSNKHQFNKIKFFALYGEWGSGKSTLMKYLKKELHISFNAFFFEAWEYESDHNLPKSLLEFLYEKSNSEYEAFIKNGKKLMEGFAKSLTFKTPIFNINAGQIIKEVEEESFFERKEKFKKDFETWEESITTEDKSAEYNIIFIDDLDRCEPESVLNLLSAIKLFFTFGKKTIFLCGIDKKAVNEAVKTKYGDVVKSNEYLEKVFDVSFTMPQENDVEKLVSFYFEGEEYTDTNGEEINLIREISNFFWVLKFENPRRVKKVLNRYKMIESLIEEDYLGFDLPNIIRKNGGTLFETILTIYLLILKEFEPEIFDQFLNLSFKRGVIDKVLYQNNVKGDRVALARYDSLKDKYFDVDENMTSFTTENGVFRKSILIFVFFPTNPVSVGNLALNNFDFFKTNLSVSKKRVDYYFVEYLFRFPIFRRDTYTYSFLDYKRMILNLT